MVASAVDAAMRQHRFIRRAIGDALEGVRDAGQLEGNLVGSAGPLQHDDLFRLKYSAVQNNRPVATDTRIMMMS